MALFNIEKFVDKINSKKKLQNTIFSIKQLYAFPSRFGIYLSFAIIGGIGLSNRLENNFLLLILFKPDSDHSGSGFFISISLSKFGSVSETVLNPI